MNRNFNLVAAFPWYDLPKVQWANDVLWRATGVSGQLARNLPVEDLWRHRELFVTQACGLDLFLSAAPIEAVAVPVFDLDCAAGHYFSYIVGDIAGRIAGVNSLSSRSGYSALLTRCHPQKVTVTGSHMASLAALQAGVVDVAAIDAISWKIIARDQPELLRGLPVVAQSPPAAAPPYVTGRGTDRDYVLTALRRAVRSSRTAAARQALFLRDIMPVQKSDYLPVLAEYNSAAKPQVAGTGVGKTMADLV